MTDTPTTPDAGDTAETADASIGDRVDTAVDAVRAEANQRIDDLQAKVDELSAKIDAKQAEQK